ncbi:MAG: hemerythrin family protein [Pseudodesulfovibrio sp.]|nr:hemerythrin family protein [Pseudodesulfovibrio sp.]
MPLINWDETMSVKVHELDEQHKTLIALINEAYEAIQKHDERVMTELINKMRAYANMHFATEEGYMKKFGFPEIENHKFKHVKFNNEVDDFKKKQFEKTNLSQIFVFLSQWLITHIMDEDMQYVPYVPQKRDKEEQE